MKRILIILILLLAFLLRVYKVGEYPTGLNADEAAIGYNAYSLLETGKDEFGHSWPINFQSFNDFKPGLYFYFVLPFVKIFGLNELAVRLPSVILGTLTVLVVYLFVRRLKLNESPKNAEFLALATSFLLAISPWHLHFSRGGWESNASLFFIVLGVYLFFSSLENPKRFAFCALSFELSMYTYHSARIISPLLLLGLALFYKKDIFKKEKIKYVGTAIIIALITAIPLIKTFTSSEGTSRFSGVGIFADQGPFWRVNELRGQHADLSGLFPKILHNKVIEYGVLFFDNWMRHFNGNFLFINGDEIQRNRIPEMGQMYFVEIPFLILGIYFLLKNRPKNWQFLLWWLGISPAASALTFQSPHAIRALNMVIPLVILTGYGIAQSFFWLKSKTRLYQVLSIMYLVLFAWNFSYYLHQYYAHYHQTYPSAWEDGFKNMVSYLSENQEKYDKIYITDKYDQPYILTAFYLKYSPKEFQQEAKLTPRDKFGFSTVERFGKYNFGKINIKEIPSGVRVLIIGSPEDVPESATIIERIYFKDGKTEAFRIVEN